MSTNAMSSTKLNSRELQEHKYRLLTIGYTIVPNFLPLDTTSILREKLHESVLDDNIDNNHLHDLLCRDIQFGYLLEDPKLQQVFSTILSEYWIMYAFTSSSLPPDGTNFGSRIHVDSPRFIPNYITNAGVIWALDDFTNDNGGTKLLPASQHSDFVPDEEIFENNCIQLNCKKGDAIFFNARVWHRAGENRTNDWRHSLTMNVCRPYMKQRMDWVRFIPNEISDQLNLQARRIIGFDTRIPSSLEEYYLKDDQRLYKPNQE